MYTYVFMYIHMYVNISYDIYIYTCRLSLKNDLIVPESIVAKDTIEVCKIYV